MGYRGQVGRSRLGGIHCNRSAAFATTTSGSYVTIPWDAESATPPKSCFAHSTSVDSENIVCLVPGRYLATGSVELVSGTWDELRASVEVNGVAVATPNVGSSSGLLGITAEPAAVSFSLVLHLALNDIVRVRVGSAGQSNVALDVGATDTWIALARF